MAGRAEADVVVAGAGLAGWTAGRQLQRAGYNALVVEAWDRAGGRVLSHSLAGGDAADAGGQFVG
jgi:monoamine oxidase